MENILLIFLVVLVVWALAPIVGRWLRRKLIEMFIKRVTGGASSTFGGFGRGDTSPFDAFFRQAQRDAQSSQQQAQADRHSHRRRTREFMQQVGETVSFEEIKTPGDTRQQQQQSNRSFKSESQISDVEWEDITL